MRSPPMFGRLALFAVVLAGAAGAAPAGSVPAGSVPAGSAATSATAATSAQWQRRAAAYALEARFYRAAGKPATAFLARRAAALSEVYRRRAVAGSEAGT